MRDIKMIIQKNDLQIAKIKRTRYGSYTTGILKQGDFSQVEPDKLIMKQYFSIKKKLIQEKQVELKDKMLKLQEVVDHKKGTIKLEGKTDRDIKMFDKSQLVKNKLIK